MLKILHIITSANPKIGGPIQGIRNYEKALVDLGVKRDLVCFDNPESIKDWDFPSTLKVIGLGESKTGWQYNNTLVPWLEKNAIQYDRIIMNGMWSYHTYATIKTIKKLKNKNTELKFPKIYLMPHGMLDPWFQKDSSRRIKAIRNYFYWYLIEKQVVNEVDGLLFTCQEELLLARTTFSGYHPKKEINIGYGIVEPPVYKQTMINNFYQKFNLEKDQKYLLFLSRIHPKKGIDLLLKAYCQILIEKEVTLPDLIIAGPGIETGYGQQLYTFVNENQLEDKIKFVNHISGETKWGAIYGCEAFVLPSHQENFGIAIAEALACSKPVLITNKINIYREIEKEEGGIVNEDTEGGIVQNIKQWLSLSELEKKEMGKKARKAYEKNFEIEQAAKKLANVMKDAI